MLNVYFKGLTKKWKSIITPALIIGLYVIMIAGIWPALKDQAEAFQFILDNPIYQSILGNLAGSMFTTWEGAFYLYIFVWLEMVIVFITIFTPTRLVTNEIDKKTLDVALSYPIPRWRYLLEKYSVFLTYNLLYPIFILIAGYFGTLALRPFDPAASMNYTLLFVASISVWLYLFALGSLSILVSTIFLDSRKSLAVAGSLIVGMYLLVRIGSAAESINFLQYISIFHYFSAGNIMENGGFLVGEFFIVFGFGLVCLIAALWIFQKRELTY
ncbi:MAG: ABC transporter permease subunit [Asgard group archaeon]|nr:ABC transporter permease subunit [Asgard group archaeon]